MQLQTFATLFTLVASSLSISIGSNVDTFAACRPIYKDIIYNCGSNSDLLTIKSISISPDSPVRGQNVTIKVQGTLKETVTGGNIHVEATRLLFTVKRDYDLCENAPKAGKECPFKQGDISFEGDVEVDKDIPAGKYDIDMLATSNTNKVISKLNLKIRVR